MAEYSGFGVLGGMYLDKLNNDEKEPDLNEIELTDSELKRSSNSNEDDSEELETIKMI